MTSLLSSPWLWSLKSVWIKKSVFLPGDCRSETHPAEGLATTLEGSMVQTRTPVEHPTASSEARKVRPLNRFYIGLISSYRAEYDSSSDLTRSIEWPPGHRSHPSLLFILEQRHEGRWRFVLKIRLNKNGSNWDFRLALISWLSTSEWFPFHENLPDSDTASLWLLEVCCVRVRSRP